MKQFMIDIETTGVDEKSDEILEVAVLELNYGGRFWLPGKSMSFVQHSSRIPTNEFAIKYMSKLYGLANAAPAVPVEEARQWILHFFKECGAKPPDVSIIGHNVQSLDLPFLTRDGYLRKNQYVTVDGKDVMIGDYHYRVDDLNSMLSFACEALFLDRKTVLAQAKTLSAQFTEGFPPLEPHRALSDCYQQLALKNALLALVRGIK